MTWQEDGFPGWEWDSQRMGWKHKSGTFLTAQRVAQWSHDELKEYLEGFRLATQADRPLKKPNDQAVIDYLATVAQAVAA